jgi:hypothetical protein
MGRLMRLHAPLAVLALALAVPAAAQLGGVPKSPPPDGLEEGQGAGYPAGHYAELDALPDWGGIWFVRFGGPGGGPPATPRLKGEYAERYQAWRAEVLANNGVARRQRSNCSAPGMPRIMRLPQYPYEFLFTPGRVTINQEAWMQTRTIWTDGREHPEDPDSTFMGHSTGHWEGDTLVVDTIAISDELEIDTGMPHSAQFHLTERIHLDPADPDVLLNEMLMEDPEALEEPFAVTVRYGRDRNGGLIEFQCSENDRNPVDDEGNTLYQ